MSIKYYHLRLEYTVTSDWSSLDLLNPEQILSVQVVEVNGKPTSFETKLARLSLNQPLADARDGKSVSLTIDYAIEAAAISQRLNFHLQKGGINGSSVQIYNVSGDKLVLIQNIDHQGPVKNDPEKNPLDFSVDLSALASTPPLTFVDKPLQLPKMVWTFYYPWYNANSWSSQILKDHPVPSYSSDDTSTMTRQIDEAQAAGIDGFISSWWGPNSYTDQNLQRLLDVAQKKNFKISIYFETLTDKGPRSKDEILSWLEYLISTYRDHPAFMKVNGKPLVVIWASETVSIEAWRDIISQLRLKGLDATFIAMGYNLANLNVFDGVHQYGVFTIPDLPAVDRATGRSVHFYNLLDEDAPPKIWIATVQPGYDERTISGRRGLWQDRQNGDFYRSTWEAALQSDPNWIFISTWNEWWEHTYIEPGELYGTQYLDITREYARKWKEK
jgi:hypothetical protein